MGRGQKGSKGSKKLKAKSLNNKMSKRLSGARFRWINEKLYTCTGSEALKLFSESPDLFSVYHQGFEEQASKWQVNPLDHMIEYVGTLPNSSVIADFGCGNAKLSQSVPHVVHSFDLVEANDHVTACDMSSVPLPDSSVDVCIFCLSLMNSNVIDFILEARRVLRIDGILRICEIRSRIDNMKDFITKIEKCSFLLDGKPRALSKMFVDFKFILKSKNEPGALKITLSPCVYKKR